MIRRLRATRGVGSYRHHETCLTATRVSGEAADPALPTPKTGVSGRGAAQALAGVIPCDSGAYPERGVGWNGAVALVLYK